MSRIGKRLISIPADVTFSVSPNFCEIEVKGPLGSLHKTLPGLVPIKVANQQISTLMPTIRPKENYPLLGTTNSLISNWIEGVTKGFSKKLIITGLGYKAILKDKILELNLGFSHLIFYPIPTEIKIEVSNNTIVTISGIDKEKVGLVASQIRKFKKTEPYKGKGVRYDNEIVHRKVGKTASTSK